LREQILVLAADRLHCVFKSLDLEGGITVVSQDVFLFNLQGSSGLLGPPFFVGKLRILLLQELVCMGTFTELLVHESVLSCQCLDVLR